MGTAERIARPDQSNADWLRAVVDTAVDGVILIDARGTILMFNPACEGLFGYPADEVIGRNVKVLMPPSYRDAHDGYLHNYHTTGDRKIIGIGREVVGQRKDGSTFLMHLSVGETKRAGEESIFVGIIHDLTGRERVERELRESAARLRAVVDTAVDGVILIDSDGIILKFNPACESLFKYHADEVLGENVRMLMPEPYRSGHDGYIRNFVATGEKKIIGIGREVVGRRKDGSTFPMDLSVGEAKQDGSSIFVGMIHDLTDRKRTEAQLMQAQKMEAVGQLSGGIAHDFNNLLTVIVGNAEHLAEQLVARGDLKRLADDICSAGERGAELTQRLLAFSRKQLLRPVETECSKLVESMHKLLRRTLREDIEISTNFDPALRQAFADPVQLESAILNLALNAQDAMVSGGRLTISTANASLDVGDHNTHPDVGPGEYIVIAVTDTGSGMPRRVLERAFEPFFTTKEVGKGSGLGLSMVYGFVKQSNGHVTIYSEPGLGTTVRIYLPAVLAKTQSAPLAVEKEVVQSGSETVLVVEDDPFVRSYAVMSLESLGYRVISAVDGKEALQTLAAAPHIDLLFTDVVMPGGVNGWELAGLARKARPEMRVLLTSGYALETLAANGHVQQGAPILEKPYRKAELARLVREALAAAVPV
ncbi:histidine kinase [Bradyrhizobium sp. CCBAU 45394]|uniref:hybrid sensor histidine kinase/response regulator n=1 Tax=unclassified Bradyrhizobium TaxID=2631580 RepID=UPI00230466A5|nr:MULTISPECIES: PAS domain S-box protein [unclassified Bradyrhizobium]MDA9396585.1 histidine kinase [Bradyrhizobium sp. CCBAU 45394]MDA9538242.1 histidine kinase [Bradyrhizobium sp. CCBAU 21362]